MRDAAPASKLTAENHNERVERYYLNLTNVQYDAAHGYATREKLREAEDKYRAVLAEAAERD